MPGGARILLVDDEPTILLGLSHVLRRAGAEVITCLGRDEAEEAILNQTFDLALLDVRLSGSEARAGLDLLTLLKQRSPRTHVIVMTAFGTDEIRREAMARGASHYCDKPINLEHLMGLLRNLRPVPTC
ncbi:MAG: response regulator [candidate division NC10 bacterium]|nr:response regulator [candidate division NC10 bacterium]